MQMKIWYYFFTYRLVKILKFNNPLCCRHCAETGNLSYCWCMYKFVQPAGRKFDNICQNQSTHMFYFTNTTSIQDLWNDKYTMLIIFCVALPVFWLMKNYQKICRSNYRFKFSFNVLLVDSHNRTNFFFKYSIKYFYCIII